MTVPNMNCLNLFIRIINKKFPETNYLRVGDMGNFQIPTGQADYKFRRNDSLINPDDFFG